MKIIDNTKLFNELKINNNNLIVENFKYHLFVEQQIKGKAIDTGDAIEICKNILQWLAKTSEIYKIITQETIKKEIRQQHDKGIYCLLDTLINLNFAIKSVTT